MKALIEGPMRSDIFPSVTQEMYAQGPAPIVPLKAEVLPITPAFQPSQADITLGHQSAQENNMFREKQDEIIKEEVIIKLQITFNRFVVKFRKLSSISFFLDFFSDKNRRFCQ